MSDCTYLLRLKNIRSGDWGNQLERMNMRVEKDNGESVGTVNGRDRKVLQFLSNEYWRNIGCLVSAHNFGIGRSSLWYK